MLDLDLAFGQVHVYLSDIQACVPQDQLERHHVAPIHQVLDSKRVAQKVCMQSRNANSPSGSLDQMCESIVGERVSLHR